MDIRLNVMSEKPLNAETPAAHLQSWITANDAFFKRNQGEIMASPVALDRWRLFVRGMVKTEIELKFSDILAMPKIEAANTLECSGNGRSLLSEKASGNPWTIGGVGNAVWGGVRLSDILAGVGVMPEARHVGFEGLDKPLGSARIQFIRSIPLEKAMSSTLLVYEMNGEPLPLDHGFPLRALALGWTGANCVKWLKRITVSDQPVAGFFMDKVYRIFQKGEDPGAGEVVTGMPLKSIITSPADHDVLPVGTVTIRGAAYAGEARVVKVEASVDGGASWQAAEFIGPDEPYAWRRWEYRWRASHPGTYRILSRATDDEGRVQPPVADWNVLGYGNNGVREHSISIVIQG